MKYNTNILLCHILVIGKDKSHPSMFMISIIWL